MSPTSSDGRAFAGTLLLTHLHWDHVQGLPFFAAGDRDDADVRVFMPDQTDADGRVREPADVLARAMSPPHFPIGPDGLRGDWRFEGLKPGSYRIEDFDVVAFDVPHKGGRTFGYRISDGASSVAYIPDHLPGPDTTPVIASRVHRRRPARPRRPVPRAGAGGGGRCTVTRPSATRSISRARCRARARSRCSITRRRRRDDDVDAIGQDAIRTGTDLGVEVFVAREDRRRASGWGRRLSGRRRPIEPGTVPPP